jgi:hypothetical protein
MSQARIILLFFPIFLLISKAKSQTADEIIQKHIEAIGGYEKIKSIRTITFEGTNKSSKLETSFKSYIIHDSAACTEGMANGKPSKGIATKKEGWICPSGTESKKSSNKKSKYEIKRDQKALDIHGPLIDYAEKGNTIKYLGIEKINDTAYYKIKLKRADKSQYIYYFDNTSYIIKRVVSLWPGGNQPELTYDYTYKAFDNGLSFVVRSVRIEDGLVTTYSNYIVNPEIDRSIFNPCK